MEELRDEHTVRKYFTVVINQKSKGSSFVKNITYAINMGGTQTLPHNTTMNSYKEFMFITLPILSHKILHSNTKPRPLSKLTRWEIVSRISINKIIRIHMMTITQEYLALCCLKYSLRFKMIRSKN